jgi:hypothetical protein
MTKTLKAEKKEIKSSKSNKYSQPKTWLRKPEAEKKVQDYYYIKSKHKYLAKELIKELLNQFN